LQALSSPTVATNHFDADGNCVVTHATAAGEAQRFFIVHSR
jgi:hypothetical protein